MDSELEYIQSQPDAPTLLVMFILIIIFIISLLVSENK